MLSLPGYLSYSLTAEELTYIFGDNEKGVYYIFKHGYKSPSLTSHIFSKNEEDLMLLSTTSISRKLNQQKDGDNEGLFYYEYLSEKSERKVTEESYDLVVSDMIDNHKCVFQYKAIVSNLTSLKATHHAYEIRSFNEVNCKELANRAIINYYIQITTMLKEVEPYYLLLFLVSEYNYLDNKNQKDVDYINIDLNKEIHKEIERVEKLLKSTWEDLYGFSLEI